MRRYKIAYKVETGSFTKPQLEKANLGGCDGIIVHSIILPEDGSRSEMIFSMASGGGQLSDDELFKSWVSMAYQLSQSKELGEGRRRLCESAFTIVQEAVVKIRLEDELREREKHDK